MKSRSLLLLTVLGLAAGLTSPSQAAGGPVPGTYVGKMARISSAAKPKVSTYNGVSARAWNPTSGATFSSFLLMRGGTGPHDDIIVRIQVLPSGRVKTIFAGTIKSRTTNRPVNFTSNTEGPGEFTPTSFKCTSKNPNFIGKPATIKTEARMVGTRMLVNVQVTGITSPGHPMRDYNIGFLGVAP